MKIINLDARALNPGDLSWDAIARFGDLTVYDRTPDDQIIERIGDAEIVLLNKTPITAATLDACPSIKLICVLATGYNVVDCDAAKARGIPVCNVPAYGTAAVAQFTFALLLELCHRVGLHSDSVHAGDWCASPDFCYWRTPQMELAGKTLGIIGFGRIGRAVGAIAKAFGMQVLAYNRSRCAEGEAIGEYVELDRLGAVVTKGVADVPWEGNDTPRVAETPSGMLNAIGLQNPGIDMFLERDLPFLKDRGTRIIVNVCGHTEEEYLRVVERLQDEPVDLLEINISCPNVKEGGIAFGQNPKAIEQITSAVKKVSKQPVIMKLSPNVTDITEMARAAEAGGADVLSLINTLTGMKIDIHRRKFAIANKTGGMSGPAVKPIAVRMVYQVAQAVNVPIIGMGGIASADDAIEFILAGATAVSVGTANFMRPDTTIQVVDGIQAYMERYGVKDIRELVGAVNQ